jgi:hypothetical protein
VIPPLQLGGVQEAVMLALPGVGPVTFALPPKAVLVVPLTATDTGFVLLHVSETPVIGMCTLSVTVASTVAEPLLFSVMGGEPALRTDSVMD